MEPTTYSVRTTNLSSFSFRSEICGGFRAGSCALMARGGPELAVLADDALFITTHEPTLFEPAREKIRRAPRRVICPQRTCQCFA